MKQWDIFQSHASEDRDIAHEQLRAGGRSPLGIASWSADTEAPVDSSLPPLVVVAKALDPWASRHRDHPWRR
jgi:hypothetical protein